ncbi:3D domain-containing protein [Paenibacillus sp. JCM 10914]|uniref:3D domain-containing protein n=1 Tax=Paenibacillus sp. JCM 10914 TaxID=1236974 RepID=UPI0003CC62FD|nr:3D domain-containing protein [Paenibacillus sp. JCM 10914]GAE05406.1 3D domain protein [Paenibacillus sp. JCM 10914]
MIQQWKSWKQNLGLKPHKTAGKTARLLTVTAVALGLTFGTGGYDAQASSTHTAKKGDTFYFLSKQYGVNLNTLMNANPTIEATNIYPGLSIKIPGTVSTNQASTAKPISNGTPVFTPSLNVYPEQKMVEAWGKNFNYSKTLSVKATAYSAAASENGGWGAVDYFGNALELGTIAVDPKVIPLGTKVLVTGHAHPGLPKKAFVAEARDIGGAIKGNKIDIFIPGSQSSVRQFGIQDIKLYIID